MKNCEEILSEFGIDFLEGEKIPEEIEKHFNTCQSCIKILEKHKTLSEVLEEKKFKGIPPEIDFPLVLRKKDRLPFLFLSIFFLFFFLAFHSIINTEFLKPYLLLITHFNLLPSLKITAFTILFIIIISSLSILLIYQLKKLLQKL